MASATPRRASAAYNAVLATERAKKNSIAIPKGRGSRSLAALCDLAIECDLAGLRRHFMVENADDGEVFVADLGDAVTPLSAAVIGSLLRSGAHGSGTTSAPKFLGIADTMDAADLDAVSLLVAHGFDVNRAAGQRDLVPLHIAVGGGGAACSPNMARRGAPRIRQWAAMTPTEGAPPAAGFKPAKSVQASS